MSKKISHYVYCLYSENSDVLYIGRTVNRSSRLADHCNYSEWQEEIFSIQLFGPYNNSKACALNERCLIAKLQPRYNTNATSFAEIEAPILKESGRRFDTISELETYLNSKPDETKRYTVYLTHSQLAALDILHFHSRKSKKKIISRFIQDGIEKASKALGILNIEEEALNRVITNKEPCYFDEEE